MIPFFIAGGCAVGLTVIWFVTVHKELSEKKRNLASLYQQLLMHEDASSQTSDRREHEIAVKMLETNRMVYREAAKSYNKLLKKPLNRLPALLLRIHPADESGNIQEKKKKIRRYST